jgi:hypothetical protein
LANTPGNRLSPRTAETQESLDFPSSRGQGSIDSAKVWALLLYAALSATLLGTLARGFGWL